MSRYFIQLDSKHNINILQLPGFSKDLGVINTQPLVTVKNFT